MSIKNYRTDLAIIVPHLSNIEGLKNLLELLKKYQKDFPIIVVNNGNVRIEKEIDLTSLPITIVELNEGRNTGFAKAVNDGAKKARELFDPNYLLFLNDDVTFEKPWINECLDEMKKLKWHATSPILYMSNGEIENVGYKVLPIGKVELIKNTGDKREIDGISATALIVQSSVFFELKGFDERFFAYLEDVDFFLRAKKAKKRFGVTKKVGVFHAGQATSSQNSTFKAWFDFRNWILLISKNWTADQLTKNFPQIAIERLRNFWGIAKTILS